MSELYIYEEDLIEDYNIIEAMPKVNTEVINHLKEKIFNTNKPDGNVNKTSTQKNKQTFTQEKTMCSSNMPPS